MTKPYQSIPIQDCGEPLVPIPLDQIAVVSPHPYAVLGAPYGDRSPYWLRESVLAALIQAQTALVQATPGWRLQIFDAYRPIPVQQFMVNHALATLAQEQGKVLATLSPEEHQALMAQVQQFWATPSLDPATPPPHSTGAAVDLTLMDDTGQPVDMGSPIDELSSRSYPDHFAHQSNPLAQAVHGHRQQLKRIMTGVGFCQHPKEWWHFSLGDQLWAWQQQHCTGIPTPAHYGGV